MKKIISIFFLTLFLLYHVGYLGFYWLSLEQINQEWLSRVEYTGLTKKVSIPITLPYWNDQSEYRSASGSITIDGVVYRKVMQKYSRDALHLILVQDTLTQNLNKSIADWVQAMSDTNPDNNSNKILKSIAKDYLLVESVSPGEPGYTYKSEKYFSYITIFHSLAQDVITPPPQV